MPERTAIIIGNDTLTRECAAAWLARGHGIAALVTRADAVAEWAVAQGLRVEPPGEGLSDRLAGTACDWLLSIANLDIIPAAVLDLPRLGAVNFHDGPLPRHAGLNAPVWALIAGETQHGIAWHMIEGGIDEGDVLVSRSFAIGSEDTALTLNTKAFAAALDSFPALMTQLEQGLNRVPQDLARRSYHGLGKRPAGHGLLDPSRPAQDLARLVRALDHGDYWNPLCLPKIWAKGRLWALRTARITDATGAPGEVLRSDGDALVLACGSGALEITGLRAMEGSEVAPREIADAGDLLGLPDIAALDAAIADTARFEPHWRKALAGMAPLRLPMVGSGQDTGHGSGALARYPVQIQMNAMASVVILAQQMAGGPCDIAFADGAIAARAETSATAPWVPLHLPACKTRSDAALALTTAIDTAAQKRGFAADLPLRAGASAQPDLGLSLTGKAIPGCALTVAFGTGQPVLIHDETRLPASAVALLAARLELVATTETDRLSDLPRLPEAERRAVLTTWNATQTPRDASLTMHRAFEAQVARTPHATALVFEGQSLSYTDLNLRANRAAHVLREMGVGPDQVVGLCCPRSVDLLVGALAILKAGGAYLPMDPAYPADRLRHFVQDSGARVIVTTAATDPSLPPHDADLLVLDAEPRLETAPETDLPDTSGPNDLAYLIYTSGSTGTPKGVMVEHRNVLNFYTGMDAHIPHDPPGTWLAVTSLSFDISVLELFWTTARGFKVVLTSDADRGLISNGPMPRGKGMAFSLYYWGNDDGQGPDKYRTLLEGARFADDNGFVAVWTPERHFHAFGGPYPNPSVTGAAVAGATRNIGVRGGSVVAPLHHPARIAEEWAVIDNLTNGKAGMAIASGWQPDDFVLRPENTPPANKPAMIDSIDTLRRLWRGEPVGFPRQDGRLHHVITQPRPVSPELPVWVTTAGNPETWREAGRLGCHVLTHLLGQSIDEVALKIGLYHSELRKAGHDPAKFTVTLMLHTYLADTRDAARETAREPMKAYLRSAAGLIKQYAWAFPAFKRPEGAKTALDLDLGSLAPDELEGILDFAFERYFNDSGLFGTIADAKARAEALQAIGVTEIACLIDYGIAPDLVLEGLRPLAQVVRQMAEPAELAADDFSIAAQIVRHGVTHLQCTPSMARMIALNDEARFALGGVRHLYLGGEPLPGALVETFRQITDARITNVYGPTETTIWSSASRAEAEPVANIGLPLANQQLYVLDEAMMPVGIGAEGELWIGGDGVTRGYWQQPELTAARFVDSPFGPGRLYRTGDLVRRRVDGRIDYIGRVDHQVKLRGFRIELGEIEAVLEAQPGIAQAVVLAREDVPGDMRLVGYYTGTPQEDARLKAALAEALPGFMVPGRFVRLEAFPLTPNKKVDRRALPAPAPATRAPVVVPDAAPPAAAGAASADVVAQISALWADLLGVAAPAARDNFFDLGGHSLLAVQAHRALREALAVDQLSITDIFRFPVLGDLAARISALRPDAPQAAAPLPEPANRAQARNEAMARRRAMRAKRRA